VSAPADFAELAQRFAGSAFAGVRILGEVGRGRRSRVYRCFWNDRECALKVHASIASERHRRLTGQGIAEFEFARNLAYYRAPGMSRYVAEPLGFVSVGATQALVQELLRGEIYYQYYRNRAGVVAASLAQDLEQMVALAHAAELFDMDLHSMNVMVVEDEKGAPVPKLFDFNLIPFTVRPQNFLVGWLLKVGLMSRRSRDLRRLRKFHDFGPIERRLKRRATES
jgi:hypothetical protein